MGVLCRYTIYVNVTKYVCGGSIGLGYLYINIILTKLCTVLYYNGVSTCMCTYNTNIKQGCW